SKRYRRENESERRARACLVVHCGLGQSACDRVTLSQGGREVCSSKTEKFLPRVQWVTVLGGKGARGGDTLDIGEQQGCSGQRNNSFQIAQPQRWAAQCGQPSGNVSGRFHSKRGETK